MVLGEHFEVINLATRDYGLDQMLLVANRIISQVSPDDVVVGFIADDLVRSCRSMSYPTIEESKFVLAAKPTLDGDRSAQVLASLAESVIGAGNRGCIF